MIGFHNEHNYIIHQQNIMNKPKLLDQVRNLIHLKHYSIRTERAYLRWIKTCIFFRHKAILSKRVPRE